MDIRDIRNIRCYIIITITIMNKMKYPWSFKLNPNGLSSIHGRTLSKRQESRILALMSTNYKIKDPWPEYRRDYELQGLLHWLHKILLENNSTLQHIPMQKDFPQSKQLFPVSGCSCKYVTQIKNRYIELHVFHLHSEREQIGGRRSQNIIALMHTSSIIDETIEQPTFSLMGIFS